MRDIQKLGIIIELGEDDLISHTMKCRTVYYPTKSRGADYIFKKKETS
jgi:hypothetical protein